jgi:hypothetical protein
MRYLRVSTASLKCPRISWSSQQWDAACNAAMSWNALALCDEDSLKASGEGYRRGRTYFEAYLAAIAALQARKNSLVGVLQNATPAES